MKIFYLILLILVLCITSVNAQGFAWNQTVTAGDTMVWDNSAVTLYYQIHPYVNSTGMSVITDQPARSSRFWTGSNNNTRRDSLAVIATTLLDSLPRIFVITNQDNYTWGGWRRYIITDGTNTDTSTSIRIGNKQGAMTVFYYFDDVGTTKLNLWLLDQGQ